MSERTSRSSALTQLPWILAIVGLIAIALDHLGVYILIALLPCVALGLVSSVAMCGPRAALSGVRFLFGRADEAELPSATRALGAGGAFLIHVGMGCALITLLSHLDHLGRIWNSMRSGGVDDLANPADLADLFRNGILLSFPALLFAGRFVLGAAAELAASRAEVAAPKFPLGVQIVALLTVPLFLSTVFLTFPTL